MRFTLKWLLPWPSRRERAAAVEAARHRAEAAAAQREEQLHGLVAEMRRKRQQNHFRELFEQALRRG